MRVFGKTLTGSIVAVFLAITRTGLVMAQGIQAGVNAAHGNGQPTVLFGDGGVFTTVVNLLLFLIGAIAVIMIVIGGFRYVLSGGDASSVTAAKNTILYAIVGIIVALLAFAIVQFVVNSFAVSGANGL